VRKYLEAYNKSSPDVVLGAGDWGDCEDYSFLEGQEVITVYGNHDKVYELKKYAKVLDGDVVELGGLKIGGVSGIVSPKGTPSKSNTPRKRPEEFVKVAERIKGVDLMVMHEAPYMPMVFGKMWRSVGPLTALTAVQEVKPKVLVVGHLHKAPSLHAKVDRCHVFHVDTSSGGYVILDTDTMVAEGFVNNIRTFKVKMEELLKQDAII